MIPLRTSITEDGNGNLCKSIYIVQERCRRHFTFNLESVFDEDEVISCGKD